MICEKSMEKMTLSGVEAVLLVSVKPQVNSVVETSQDWTEVPDAGALAEPSSADHVTTAAFAKAVPATRSVVMDMMFFIFMSF